MAPVTFSTEAGLAGVPVHLKAPAGKMTDTDGKTSEVFSLKDMWTHGTVGENDERNVDGWSGQQTKKMAKKKKKHNLVSYEKEKTETSPSTYSVDIFSFIHIFLPFNFFFQIGQ